MRTYGHTGILLAIALGAAGRLVAGPDPADAHPDLHLIPWPKSLERADGHLRVTADVRIVVADDRLKSLGEVLAEDVRILTGMTLRVLSDAPRAGDIVLRLNPGLKAGEPILMFKDREPVRASDGAHTLTVTDRVVVEGFDYRATAEGTATLLQLLGRDADGIKLPRVTIKDWPHADYCG